MLYSVPHFILELVWLGMQPSGASGHVKITSNRNNDELSSWSYVSVTSMVFPTKTALLEH